MIEQTEEATPVSLSRYGPAALLVGGIGIVACALGGFQDAKTSWQSYLFAFIVWAMLSLGCFGLTLMHHALQGKWALPALRLYEAASGRRMFGLLALLFLPILVTVISKNTILYPWLDDNVVAKNSMLAGKTAYLNVPFFVLRAIVFFMFWTGLSRFMRKSTLEQDETKNTRLAAIRASWGAAGIVFFVLSITFAFTDWVMSLEPTWSSTMYGPWFVVGMGLAGLAFVTLIQCLNYNRAPYDTVVNPERTRDLGNMMLAFTMLWAYTSLSQYLIIWSGNLPDQTLYYVHRSQHNWNFLGGVILIGQFFIPFIALLSPRVKAQPKLLAWVAGWILFVRVLDMYYTVIPAMPGRVPMPVWQDIAAFIGVGGLWIAVFASAIKRAPLLPLYDPRLKEEAHAH